MATDLDRALVALRESSRRQVAQLRASCPGPLCPEARLGLAFQPGDQVLDLVTGKVGYVNAGAVETILIPPT